MTSQIPFLSGAVGTMRTFKWLFPCVDPLMAYVVSLIVETLATVRAYVGAAGSPGCDNGGA